MEDKIEIIYTAMDEPISPEKPLLYGNLLLSRDSFVAVDCICLPKWNCNNA